MVLNTNFFDVNMAFNMTQSIQETWKKRPNEVISNILSVICKSDVSKSWRIPGTYNDCRVQELACFPDTTCQPVLVIQFPR